MDKIELCKIADSMYQEMVFEPHGMAGAVEILERVIATARADALRDAADRIEAWWRNPNIELSMALDKNIAQLRAAILADKQELKSLSDYEMGENI